MSRVVEAARVIARRDFVATVWTKSFILFLLAPVLAIGFGLLMGQVTRGSDMEARNPPVAVIADEASAAAILAARKRLATAVGEHGVPRLRVVAPEGEGGLQARRLLDDAEGGYSAVLGGTLERPVLTAPGGPLGAELNARIGLIVEEARRTAALERAGGTPEPAAIERVVTESAAGAAQWNRRALARGGQFVIFFITLMLGTMLLSNLVEEKSSKVIEVLAAAVPLDSIFLGKLMAMLAVSLLGLLVWGATAFAGLQLLRQAIEAEVAPAVGWPAYAVLLLLYFSSNYMLLGAVFLGIGGQASSVREVQTLNMPITFAQVAVFLLASLAVADGGGWLGWSAALFPLSSPLAMIALAAQQEGLWMHAAALLWQALWVVIIIRLFSRLFRRTVLKSGSRLGFFQEMAFWRR
ncbi:MAG: ABC transporter permease [Allosphingosinicella sp.]|uniref:ABC transporter permease n=1 Tax=Allosphingosinicella sp. TaxID=2823234 RepID=UPI003937FD8E